MKMKVKFKEIFIFMFIVFIISYMYSSKKFDYIKTRICGKNYEEKKELKGSPLSWRLRPCLNKKLKGVNTNFAHYYMEHLLKCKLIGSTAMLENSEKIYRETWKCSVGIFEMWFDLSFKEDILQEVAPFDS